MPKRSSKKIRNEDPNKRAARIVREATAEGEAESTAPEPEPPEKNPAAVALGKLGGQKGGKARAESLHPERRREIARKAALARWKKKDDT